MTDPKPSTEARDQLIDEIGETIRQVTVSYPTYGVVGPLAELMLLVIEASGMTDAEVRTLLREWLRARTGR